MHFVMSVDCAKTVSSNVRQSVSSSCSPTTSSPTNLHLIWCFFTVVFFKDPNSPITNTPPFPASRFLEFFSKSHRHQSPTNHGIPSENLVFPGKSYGLRLDGNGCCLRSYHSRVAHGGRLGTTVTWHNLKLVSFLYHFHAYIIICLYIYIYTY